MSGAMLQHLQRQERELRRIIAAAHRIAPEPFRRRDYFDALTLARRYGWSY
jgi:hypothetical protein